MSKETQKLLMYLGDLSYNFGMLNDLDSLEIIKDIRNKVIEIYKVPQLPSNLYKKRRIKYADCNISQNSR